MDPKLIKSYLLDKADLQTLTDINGFTRPKLNTYKIIDKVYQDRYK